MQIMQTNELILILLFLAGGAVGAGAVAAWTRGRVAAERAEAQRLALEAEYARALADEIKASLPDSIKAAAADAMRGNNEQFLALAGERLAPIGQHLDAFAKQLHELDEARVGDYRALTTQVTGLTELQHRLSRETSNLVTALRKPHVRGRWGEISLRNAVEAAGMTAYCDFSSQVSVSVDDRVLRPDLVVRLPGGKQIVVDAKVSLDAYLDATAAEDEAVQADRLADHARQVRTHLHALAKKSYADQFSEAPECVVMFLPVESMLSAALEAAPALFEEAARHKVLLATPTTLLGILFAIAHVWRQEAVAEHAARISETGQELYQRLQTMGDHFAKLGRGVKTVVSAYNDTVGSLEGRVLVTARRFGEFGAATGELAEPEVVEAAVRPLTAPELVPEAGDARVVEFDRVAEG
jgi:DNA recombination protein RmuC